MAFAFQTCHGTERQPPAARRPRVHHLCRPPGLRAARRGGRLVGSDGDTQTRVRSPESTQAVHTAPSAGARVERADPDASSDAVEQVDWRRRWYAIRPVVDLPTDRPVADTILGKDVVIWQDGQAEWRVFEDKCPHRKVKLSEGRVESDGTLSCAYHGWRFDGQGACTSIPQLTLEREGDSDSVSRLLSRPSACAVHFPTKQANGMLFVWMDAGREAETEAARTALPAGDPECVNFPGPWFSRDVEMSVEILMENVLDPSHVPFSHHGIQGNRNKPPSVTFQDATSHGARGFEALSAAEAGALGSAVRCAFPSLALIGPPGKLNLVAYTTPLTRMRSRLNFIVAMAFPLPTFFGLPLRKPIWLDHLERNAIIDGDGIFLSAQARAHAAGRLTHRDYFMPASADRGVQQLWQLLDRHCVRGPNYYEHVSPPPSPLSRRDYLDRFRQHTQTCHACRGALQKAVAARWVVAGLATAVSLWGVVCAAVGVALEPWMLPACGVVVAGCLGVVRLLNGLISRLTFADYVHAERD